MARMRPGPPAYGTSSGGKVILSVFLHSLSRERDSFSTPAQLGDQASAFGHDVRDAVLALHPSGVITEPFRVEVLVASRP